MKPARAIVFVEGGVVTDVYSNRELDLDICDYDNTNEDTEIDIARLEQEAYNLKYAY